MCYGTHLSSFRLSLRSLKGLWTGNVSRTELLQKSVNQIDLILGPSRMCSVNEQSRDSGTEKET